MTSEPARSAATPGRLSWRAELLCAAVLLALCFPLFLGTMRTLLFHTVPYDDYAPLLLRLAGRAPDVPLVAPYAYRTLSLVPALPLLGGLPLIRLTNAPGGVALGDEALRAYQALALYSYLATVGTGTLLFRTARERGATVAAAGAVAAGAALLMQYGATTGPDPWAALLVALIAWRLERPAWAVPLLLASAAVNEKLPFVFAGLFFGRFLADRRTAGRWLPQKAATLAAILGYFAAVKLLHYPDVTQQLSAGSYAAGILTTLRLSLTPRGLVLNVLPVALLGWLWWLGVRAARRNAAAPPGAAGDGFAVVLLAAMAAAADVKYNVGRIALYSLPLLLPPVARLLDDAGTRKGSDG